MQSVSQTTFQLTLVALCLAPNLFAQNPFNKTVRVAPHLEPAIPHPQQEKAAAGKLAARFTS